jgi:hypothetical protein
MLICFVIIAYYMMLPNVVGPNIGGGNSALGSIGPENQCTSVVRAKDGMPY